jgi:FlaA1/EpsC-like NDP-sugar epimerase
MRQADMKKEFPNCIYHLGDVTNPFSLPHIEDPGSVFNLAAMKHVELGETNFEYCLNVNFRGVVNTYSWAFEHGAKSYSQSSTDKAVEPWNTYGAAKMLAEKYLFSRQEVFPVSVFSWANVIGSRGSVLHKFAESLINEGCVYVTDPDMTRMWVDLEDVAAFMWERKSLRSNGRAHIPQMKSSTLLELAYALAEVLDVTTFEEKIIGIRPGEKKHETMIADYAERMSSDTCERYSHSELVELVRRSL